MFYSNCVKEDKASFVSVSSKKHQLKMWMSFVYLILLSYSITLGHEYFNCGRQGQDCANNKTCQNDGTCDCGNDYTGYNCELQKSVANESGYGNSTVTSHFCESDLYGEHCENKRYEVSCQKSYMLIVINPAGTFSGVVYVKGEKDTTGCTFTKSYLPEGKQGVALNVQDSDCGGVSQLNGDRTRDVIIQFSDKFMTNLDTKVSVTCEMNDSATTVTVTKVITSDKPVLNRQNITNTVNSIDSSLVQFNINLKDGSSVSESAAVSLDEELTFEFSTNLTVTVPQKIRDLKPVSVRLADGNTTKEGRLELLKQGTWVLLSSYNFHYFEATVVCRTLGFNNAFGMPRDGSFFPDTNAPVLFLDARCDGFEMDVDDCARWKFYNNFAASLLGIICDENPAPYKLRLVDGRNDDNGKLQVFDDDKWKSVCYTAVSDHAASVVCRQLGYANYDNFVPYNDVAGAKWKYDVHCLGYEPALHLCVLNHRYVNSRCQSVLLKCSVDISNIELRLVGGPSSNYGVVEVKINNEWGRLYDFSPSPADAKVMCRTLGYNESYGAILLEEDKTLLNSTNPKVWISEVRCVGLEKSFKECYFNIEDSSHDKFLALLCEEDNQEIKIRLVNGSSEREGRVEIKYLGMWGTVCDKFHTDYNAAVYCRMLGFTNSNATAVGSAYFGEGSGHIILRDIHCLGNETSLQQCNILWGNFDCQHENDAGVICAETESGTVRVESCTADNQKTGEDSETLKIIENSCPSSEIGKLMIQEPERSGNNVTFKLKAFTFNKNNAVSTECSVKVCPPDQKSLCDPVDCNGKKGFGRKRRSAETSDELVRKTFTVLNLMVEDRPPSKKHGSAQVDVNNTILIGLSVVMVIIFSLVIGIVVVVFLRKKKTSLKKENFNKHQI